jgi:6-pyruvoyl-tetrahydropterin synthase
MPWYTLCKSLYCCLSLALLCNTDFPPNSVAIVSSYHFIGEAEELIHTLFLILNIIPDFSVIKETVNRLDHTYLNDIIENPTAETIAIWICKEIMKITDNAGNVENVIVQVFETDKSYAQISSEELAERMNQELKEPEVIKNEPDKDIGTQIVEGEEDEEGEEDAGPEQTEG